MSNLQVLNTKTDKLGASIRAVTALIERAASLGEIKAAQEQVKIDLQGVVDSTATLAEPKAPQPVREVPAKEVKPVAQPVHETKAQAHGRNDGANAAHK